jgi:hypothetical protein
VIINSSGFKSASGSFKINPDFESFDSRRHYLSKVLGNVDKAIEDVITNICYDGKPCLGEVRYFFITVSSLIFIVDVLSVNIKDFFCCFAYVVVALELYSINYNG